MPPCEADVPTGPLWRMRSNGGDSSRSAPYHRLPIGRDNGFEPPESPAIGKRWTSSRGLICPGLIFPALWLFIGLVAAFDTYLTVKYQSCLIDHEMNPLARALLRLDGWEPALLIGSKFLGSLIVLGILTALHLRNRRLGLTVAGGLAAFQLGLLWYLVAV
jgi:hypothetical protein